jgi:hypothetical protein
MILAGRELLLLLLGGALAGGQIASASAVLAASTVSPGNLLGTGTSTWFGANGTGMTLCTGANATLGCPFGTRAAVGTTVATATLTVKTGSTYVVTVVNGTGPTGIATIVSATFVSTGTASATLAAGATDTLNVALKIKGGTPAGTYTGTILLADQVSGITATFPISVTH